jgi:hypothetical protein
MIEVRPAGARLAGRQHQSVYERSGCLTAIQQAAHTYR